MSRNRTRLLGVAVGLAAAAGGAALVDGRRRGRGAPAQSSTAQPGASARVVGAGPSPARSSVAAVRAAVVRPVEVARPALELARAQRLARLGRVSDALMGLLAVVITLLLGDRILDEAASDEAPIDEATAVDDPGVPGAGLA